MVLTAVGVVHCKPGVVVRGNYTNSRFTWTTPTPGLQWTTPTAGLQWTSPTAGLQWTTPTAGLQWTTPTAGLQWTTPTAGLQWFQCNGQNIPSGSWIGQGGYIDYQFRTYQTDEMLWYIQPILSQWEVIAMHASVFLDTLVIQWSVSYNWTLVTIMCIIRKISTYDIYVLATSISKL